MSPEAYRQDFLRTRRFEQNRVKALSAAAPFLADAIPTLRVLSVADLGISDSLMSTTGAACTADDLAADFLGFEENNVPYVREWDALRCAWSARKRGWWRVIDGEPEGRALVEVSDKTGECARALIEDPAWDGSEAGLEGASYTSLTSHSGV